MTANVRTSLAIVLSVVVVAAGVALAQASHRPAVEVVKMGDVDYVQFTALIRSEDSTFQMNTIRVPAETVRELVRIGGGR